ncbi:hypothetical protein HYS79_00185 [Patescibacteria group bacterium]|nr:hypothetical protein [Patescibacteria group bacterium]
MSNIERRVMACVVLIYTARALVSRVALEFYVLVFSLVGVAMLASLPHVVQNLVAVSQSGVGGVAVFFASAIVSTTLAVQVALVFGGAALASLLFDIRRFLFTRALVA